MNELGPDDPRYLAVVEKRFNKRFRANPDYVRLVSSTDQVVTAVEDAVREDRRLAVTSGGHCLEGFVSNPSVRVIVDMSPMKSVLRPDRRAIAVEAGATVGETFRALFEQWESWSCSASIRRLAWAGTWPVGPSVFCRQLGLAADYLHAVEVVTVNAADEQTASSRPAIHPIRITISGGRIPAAAPQLRRCYQHLVQICRRHR